MSDYEQLVSAAKIVCEKCAGGNCETCPVTKSIMFLTPQVKVKEPYYSGSVYLSCGTQRTNMPFRWPHNNQMDRASAEGAMMKFLVERPMVDELNSGEVIVMQIDTTCDGDKKPYCKVILE